MCRITTVAWMSTALLNKIGNYSGSQNRQALSVKPACPYGVCAPEVLCNRSWRVGENFLNHNRLSMRLGFGKESLPSPAAQIETQSASRAAQKHDTHCWQRQGEIGNRRHK